MKTSIKDLNAAELDAWLCARDQKSFRRQQVWQWLYAKQCTSFAKMRNLPAALIAELDANFYAFTAECLKAHKAPDQTEKFLFQLPDAEMIETVLIRAPARDTVCISTQVGCPVHCRFCASGQGKFIRNLAPGEIIDQVLFANRQLGGRVSNVVVMGMGEPLLNLDNLLRALEAICDPDRLGLGRRRITVSTSGIPAGIRRLADARHQWNLALSLHAVTDTVRARLIPTAHRHPLRKILDACQYYKAQTGRTVTLEYALIGNENCSLNDARQLALICRDLKGKVNLIPYNETGDRYRAPTAADTQRFEAALRAEGVAVTVRRRKGTDIHAACGQLQHNQLKPPSR